MLTSPHGRLFSVAVVLLLLGAMVRAEPARAYSRGFQSTVGTATGYMIQTFPPAIVPTRADWHAGASVQFTNYGPYNHLDRFDHVSMTERDYSGYSGHLGTTITSQIYNGYGQLRYTFSNWFGFGCYYPPNYTTITCGGQPTDIWIDPNPGYARVTAVMGFYGSGWYNTGGNSFDSVWARSWP